MINENNDESRGFFFLHCWKTVEEGDQMLYCVPRVIDIYVRLLCYGLCSTCNFSFLFAGGSKERV